MELKKEVWEMVHAVLWWYYLKGTDHQPMDMMPTANLMNQDSFKRAPISSAPTTNMLTPSQPPKVVF